MDLGKEFIMNVQHYHERRDAVEAALGKRPFDLLLKNARLVDVVTGEIRNVDVGLVGSIIASVHDCEEQFEAKNIHDLKNAYLSPGLIDMHVHIESSHLLPHRYAEQVVAQGTTTVFWDPHELANVMGIDGVRYAVNASRNLPLRVVCQASSSVPSTEALEMSGAQFGGDEMHEMLSCPEIASVAEMMDMDGILNASQRMCDILDEGLQSGKLIEGHARGLSGRQLQAYMAAGVSSDHELTSGKDMLEKLRAGLSVEMRVSHPYLIPEFVEELNKLPHLSSQLMLCTDDVPPDQLIQDGGIIKMVRLLVANGMKATDALRLATLNASLRLQRNDIGIVCAGRKADLVVFDNLEKLNPICVYSNGQKVAENGKVLFPFEASIEELPRNTMHIQQQSLADFDMHIAKVKDGKVTLRTIVGARFTSFGEKIVEVHNHIAQIPQGQAMIWVRHRHGRHDKGPQMALIEDWGVVNGAIATSYSHDSHNLVAIGGNQVDMLTAVNCVVANGGGMALAKDGKIIAEVALPVAGMLSVLPAAQLAKEFAHFRAKSEDVFEWKPPYRVFKAIEGTCLACNRGPHLTDLGLVDGDIKKIVDPVIDNH